MASIGAEWREEKAGFIISTICFLLEQTKKQEGLPSFFEEEILKGTIYAMLHNATKLYCDAIEDIEHERTKKAPCNRWSPDLSRFLIENPEKVEEVLEIVASDDYRDNYYD